jgi:hypothetical protein
MPIALARVPEAEELVEVEFGEDCSGRCSQYCLDPSGSRKLQACLA